MIMDWLDLNNNDNDQLYANVSSEEDDDND